VRCDHRFSCFTSNEIFIKPQQLNEAGDLFKAEFYTPKCVRVGLLKDLNSDAHGWQTRRHQPYGNIYGNIWFGRLWTKLPNIVYLQGRYRGA
jgi:hypothetical protein